jgi:hypothetical protein
MGIFIPFVFKLFTYISVIMRCLSDLPYAMIKEISDSIIKYNTRSSVHFTHIIECMRDIDFNQINAISADPNGVNEASQLIPDFQLNLESPLRIRSMQKSNMKLKCKMLLLMGCIAIIFLLYLITTTYLQTTHFSKDEFSIQLLPNICMRKTLSTICMAFTNEISRSQSYFEKDIEILDTYLTKYRDNENAFANKMTDVKSNYSDVSETINKINSIEMCSLLSNQTNDLTTCQRVLSGALKMGLKTTISITEMYVRGLKHLMMISNTIKSSDFAAESSKYKYSILSNVLSS